MIFKIKNPAMRKMCLCVILFLLSGTPLIAQQIDIPRVNRMPNRPEPYLMRDWKQVAAGYDSLVFDLTATGEYLPLVWTDGNSTNYPEHNRFGLDSYVGVPYARQAEAINVIPAVVGATLAGIDKSNQSGMNWVLMCEEFFNRRPAENVYLNGFSTNSGNDWWYDTMPNVFFYQLYFFYPGTGDFEYQFTTVADRWLEAVTAMGGSAAPWEAAYMDYRAWALSTMTPLDVGVKEPEAAGAIAWILYNAFVRTGEEKYRMGAEWAMEFLSARNMNPSYELQLPYGVYAAARMNAELGTDYDVEKMINWCFDPSQCVRNWGATVGRWGDYDCDGLIGEAKYAGYAFAMNGFEMASALVPMVRYDDRFARAIGKWMLNGANASRLFYTNYLPDEHQDSEEWAHVYDPHSYIAHEALREYDLNSGISPFATGDAIRGGWSQTNLALYGGSHVGIFGGIIDTTNVEMILRLDALKTDYFRDEAYPTYLYFNPWDEEKTVEIDVGTGSYDLYDAVSNAFMQTGVSGTVSFAIPADSPVLIVAAPAGGAVTYELEKTLINGVVVDYRSDQPVANYPPRIKALASESVLAVHNTSVSLYCTAVDKDSDPLTYLWTATGGVYEEPGPAVQWIAPDQAGTYTLSCRVEDGSGGVDSARVEIEVVEFINHAPVIDSLKAEPRMVHLETQSSLLCFASDSDGDTLTYTWKAFSGSLEPEDSAAVWTAPGTQGFYYVSCTVQDGRGGTATDSIGIVVQDTSDITTGVPIAYYPFNGNANDESGMDHHGVVKGAVLTEDQFGNTDSAYLFNGSSDLIQVSNSPDLNFQDAITVTFWMRPDELFTHRESYPISHGNWETRWKISIGPERKIRWTVKTNLAIRDLDSQTLLMENVFYFIAAVYDGNNFDLYINGILDNHTTLSGKIEPTTHDLTIAQHLPGSSGYNFKGVMDEIRIYDYALTSQDIVNLFQETPVIHPGPALPDRAFLDLNYPNPFNSRTVFQYQVARPGRVGLRIYNVLGQRIRILVDRETAAGYYTAAWDGTSEFGADVPSGIYIAELKTQGFLQRRKLMLVR
jgi:hypothetical protein